MFTWRNHNFRLRIWKLLLLPILGYQIHGYSSVKNVNVCDRTNEPNRLIISSTSASGLYVVYHSVGTL